MERYRALRTPHGHLAYIASPVGVTNVILPEPSRAALAERLETIAPGARQDTTLLPDLADELQQFFAGTPLRTRHAIDWGDASPFIRRVWEVCRTIPFGETTTYGALAARAGRPRAARAVGLAMARNRCPILVPCHRVLRSDGQLGGWSGPGGLGFKQMLLDLEKRQSAAVA
jgi:methylated-DNA-[protein]-cysteine S-methyltransferase